MDKETYCLDTAQGPSSDTPRVDPPAAVPHMAPRRHRTVLWVLAHMVWFRISERRTTSAQEYSDFLRRARWKAHQATGRVDKAGSYLAIL